MDYDKIIKAMSNVEKAMRNVEKAMIIVKRLADMDCRAASEIDGDECCFFCGAWLDIENHGLDCLYVDAVNLAQEEFS